MGFVDELLRLPRSGHWHHRRSWASLMATAGVVSTAYARHDPASTALHGLVARHIETFVRFAEERSGNPLPRYVVEEFRSYLRCGVLAHGCPVSD